jgi:hypothetical protein
MSSFGPLQKLSLTVVASGAFKRNWALEPLSTRGYAAPGTLVEAGAKLSVFCAQQQLENKSSAIPIFFIEFLSILKFLP